MGKAYLTGIAFYLSIVLLSLPACTVKSYDGPERPDAELSKITIRSSGGPQIQSVIIDNRNFGGIGDVYKVLPGSHVFEIRYRFEDKSMCSDSDQWCPPNVQYGRCNGTIITKPDRTYLVTIENYFALVRGAVSSKGYFDLFSRDDEPEVGTISCNNS